MMARQWSLFNCVKDEAFAWASKRLDLILTPWNRPRNVENMERFSDMLAKMSDIMQRQTAILTSAAQQPMHAQPLLGAPSKVAPGTLSESQMARLLALAGLEWNEQDKVPPIGWNS